MIKELLNDFNFLKSKSIPESVWMTKKINNLKIFNIQNVQFQKINSQIWHLYENFSLFANLENPDQKHCQNWQKLPNSADFVEIRQIFPHLAFFAKFCQILC